MNQTYLRTERLEALLLNLRHPLIDCENGTAFWTFNLCLLVHPRTPKGENC